MWQHGEHLVDRVAPDFFRIPSSSMGETKTAWIGFNFSVLNIMSKLPGFLQAAEEVSKRRSIGKWWRCNPVELVNANPAAWALPIAEEPSRLGWLEFPPGVEELLLSRPRDYEDMARYSAASYAIRFAQYNMTVVLRGLRRIVLREDQISTNDAPSHAQGLIWFCRQFPLLRIERSVNLWTAVISLRKLPNKPLKIRMITGGFGAWILEALELREKGMPEGSFRLTFDGGPIPAKASQVFEVVKGHVARQAALDLCYDRNILPRPSWLERRCRKAYQFEGFPQAITSLQKGEYSSFIECNFDLGEMYNPETLIEERVGWTAEQWEKEREDREEEIFDIEALQPITFPEGA